MCLWPGLRQGASSLGRGLVLCLPPCPGTAPTATRPSPSEREAAAIRKERGMMNLKRATIGTRQLDPEDRRIKLHGDEGFAAMRKAGRLAAEVLDFITPHVKPGVTTDALDRLCHGFILDHG